MCASQLIRTVGRTHRCSVKANGWQAEVCVRAEVEPDRLTVPLDERSCPVSHRRTTPSVGCVLVFAACTVTGQPYDPVADELAIRALAQRSAEAEKNEDLEAWLSTVADDAVIVGASGPLRGKQAIRESFAKSFDRFDWEGGWTLEAIEISGDLAVMWGPLDVTKTPRAGGDPSRTVGYHLDVARRQPDGSWQFTWWTVAAKPVSGSSVQ